MPDESGRPERDHGTGRPPDGAGLGTVALGRMVLPAVGLQLAIYLLGFSQFEATAPLVARRLMGLPLYSVSLMLTLNVLVVVAAQRPVTRLLERRSESAGLRVGLTLWAAGYAVAAVAALGPAGLRLAGLLALAIIFAIGECAYSCSFHPLLISLVPESELARGSALANSAMGIGTLAGPSIGVALVLTGSASTVWLALAGCLSGVIVAAGVLARRAVASSAAGRRGQAAN